MSNDYYTPTGTPSDFGFQSSQAIRDEFQRVANGFSDLEPAIPKTAAAYGATGSGDATVGLTAMFSSGQRQLILDGTKTYVVPGNGLYLPTTPFTLEGNGATIDLRTATGGNSPVYGALNLFGSVTQTINVMGDLAALQETITLASTAGLSPNDWLCLRTSQVFFTTLTLGEWLRIKSINGNTVTLWTPVAYSYVNAGNSLRVEQVATAKGGIIRNLNFIGLGDGAKYSTGIRAFLAEDFILENVKTDGCDYCGVFVDRSISGRVYGGGYSHAEYAGLAYGIGVANGSQDITVDGITGFDLRHTFTAGGSVGINRRIKVVNSTALAARDAGFDSHPPSDGVIFDNLHVEPATAGLDGIVLQGSGAIASNIVIDKNATARHGVLSQPCGPTARGTLVSNVRGRATNSLVLVSAIASAPQSVDSVIVSDVNGYGGTNLVSVTAAAGQSVRGFKISGVVASRLLPARAIVVQASGTGAVIQGGSIQGVVANLDPASTSENIYLQGTGGGAVSRVSVTGCVVSGGSFGLRGVGTDQVTTAANIFNPNGSGAYTARNVAGTNNQLGNDILGTV